MGNSQYARPVLQPKHDSYVAAGLLRSVYVETDKLYGTGTVVQTGLVLTNWHILEGRAEIRVNKRPASLVHFDLRLDLAALAVKTRRVAPMRFQNRVKKCMPVFYVGNPENWTGAVTLGRVVWCNRRLIATTAMPGDGSSGSGLYDLNTGELIGIIYAGDGQSSKHCFGLAVPARAISEFWLTVLWKYGRAGAARVQEKPKEAEQISLRWD